MWTNTRKRNNALPEQGKQIQSEIKLNKAHRFPSRQAVWTSGAFVIAMLSYALCLWLAFQRLNTVEKLYLRPYARTWWLAQQTTSLSKEHLLKVVTARGTWRIALAGEVESSINADGSTAYAVTSRAMKEGLVDLAYDDGDFNDAELHAILARFIYHGRSLWSFLSYPTYGALAILLVGLVVAFPKDAARARIRREGRRVDGPELVTVDEFNQRMGSDGIGFDHVRRKNRKQIAEKDIAKLRIPQEMEKLHHLILGDTGTGKSAVTRQILMQIRDREEGAVIYDPAREYLPQFFDAARGDVVLNPPGHEMSVFHAER
jgi:hypothetical protein